MLIHLFTVMVKGIENIWILGDEFAYTSFHQYYKENKHQGRPMTYAFEKYEIVEHLTTKFSNERSTLGRIRNNLVAAVNKYPCMPKLIVIVLDYDVLKQVHSKNELTNTVQIGRMTEWLAREFSRVVESYKDNLPSKAKNDTWPHLLWIAPPAHRYFSHSANSKREIFGNCLSTVVKMYSNMTLLRMIKVWDSEDTTSVLYDSSRYTAQGLTNYWLSVDSAIRFWDVAISPKFNVSPGNKQNKKIKQKNKYKWKNPKNGI